MEPRCGLPQTGKQIFDSKRCRTLKKKPNLLAAILETAVDAIVVIDRQGLITQVNPAVTSLFGYTIDELLGHNVKMLMPSPYRDEHDGYLENYCRTGTRKIIGIGREVTGKRKDGSTFPIHLAVNEFELDGERLFAGIIRDISDLKAAQDDLVRLNEALDHRVREKTRQLEQAQAELVSKEKLATLGQVSGGIAHEIRNPLNAVRMSAYYLLHAKKLTPEKLEEHLRRIDRQVGIIDSAISALSDVARMPDPQTSNCDLDSMIRSAIENVSDLGSIDIQNMLPPGKAIVSADHNQLSIVFRNLIRNARDAMPQGGTLTIEMSASFRFSPDHVHLHKATTQPSDPHEAQVTSPAEITVAFGDTGVGIAPDRLQQIFEPFYSTKARGMGLGLSITRSIVEKNGGRMSVESETNVGTSVMVTLPRGDVDDSPS